MNEWPVPSHNVYNITLEVTLATTKSDEALRPKYYFIGNTEQQNIFSFLKELFFILENFVHIYNGI